MPKCDCHGVEKKWHIDKRRKSGGYFTCSVRRRAIRNAAQARYRKTPKGLIVRRKYQLGVLKRIYTQQLEELRNG